MVEWEEIRWRPLVAYCRSHLEDLYALIGIFLALVPRHLGIGLNLASPRSVVEIIHIVNDKTRPSPMWTW